jgi:hypothetical protein
MPFSLDCDLISSRHETPPDQAAGIIGMPGRLQSVQAAGFLGIHGRLRRNAQIELIDAKLGAKL